MERLTVAKLIELLYRCPQDAEVYVEGCDCIGDAVDVQVDTSGVIISRTKIEQEQSIF